MPDHQNPSSVIQLERSSGCIVTKGTDITGGDIFPCFDIRSVMLLDKHHYSHSQEDFARRFVGVKREGDGGRLQAKLDHRVQSTFSFILVMESSFSNSFDKRISGSS